MNIVLVEKILRVQPNVKKLYLLIRASDNNSARQRFTNEVIKDQFCFYLIDNIDYLIASIFFFILPFFTRSFNIPNSHRS